MLKSLLQQELGNPVRVCKRLSEKRKQAGEKIDYNTYHFSVKEIVKYIVLGNTVIALFGYFFYRSVFITILASPLIIPFLWFQKKRLCRKQKDSLSIQFKEALISVNSSLQAGYSIENAFFESYRDMVMFYGKDSLIANELINIKKGIRNNRTLEEMLFEFGKRSGIDDIQDFANILFIGKQSGGNIKDVIENTITVIEEKINVLQEINTMISSRRFEQIIMNAIPFFIIFYIELTANGFFSILYTTVFGRILMTVCLIIYIISVLLSNRIMNIQV